MSFFTNLGRGIYRLLCGLIPNFGNCSLIHISSSLAAPVFFGGMAAVRGQIESELGGEGAAKLKNLS